MSLAELNRGPVRGMAHARPLPQQQNKHYTHRATIAHTNALCHFHIAASINPATGKLFSMHFSVHTDLVNLTLNLSIYTACCLHNDVYFCSSVLFGRVCFLTNAGKVMQVCGRNLLVMFKMCFFSTVTTQTFSGS